MWWEQLGGRTTDIQCHRVKQKLDPGETPRVAIAQHHGQDLN